MYTRRIGSRIREARVARGLNRSQLARRIGTAWVVVDRWEKGTAVPTILSIIRIAEVLRVSFDQLLGETESSPAPDSEALSAFKRLLAPRDMTSGELRWLEAVPTENVMMTPEDFAELLRWCRLRRDHERRIDARREETSQTEDPTSTHKETR